MLLAAALSVTAMTAHADYQCSVTPRAIVRKWLEERKLEEVRTSELFDVWWD